MSAESYWRQQNLHVNQLDTLLKTVFVPWPVTDDEGYIDAVYHYWQDAEGQVISDFMNNNIHPALYNNPRRQDITVNTFNCYSLLSRRFSYNRTFRVRWQRLLVGSVINK